MMRLARFAMTNQRYNKARIGMEKEYNAVVAAIAKATPEQKAHA